MERERDTMDAPALDQLRAIPVGRCLTTDMYMTMGGEQITGNIEICRRSDDEWHVKGVMGDEDDGMEMEQTITLSDMEQVQGGGKPRPEPEPRETFEEPEEPESNPWTPKEE